MREEAGSWESSALCRVVQRSTSRSVITYRTCRERLRVRHIWEIMDQVGPRCRFRQCVRFYTVFDRHFRAKMGINDQIANENIKIGMHIAEIDITTV